MRDFRIGDRVATIIEGEIVGLRVDERGESFKVEYEDVSGVLRQRWLFPDELYHDDDDDRGGCECSEADHIAIASACLH